ncbi:hypothetical protein GF420_03475 [candidate division GN15 bacterium]|nr:hypothetical protein [candidate division GN15 bacterium]
MRATAQRLLLHPVFLVALTLLILNDHLLKALWPSILTGKLSDFAGLFVFTVCIACLSRHITRSHHNLIILHLAVASLWIAWKLAPVERIFLPLETLTGLPMPSRVKDASDLLALAILPVSYRYIRARISVEATRSPFVSRRFAVLTVAIVSVIAMSATTVVKRHHTVVQTAFDASISDTEFLVALEEVLRENRFEVRQREYLAKGQYRYDLVWAVNAPPDIGYEWSPVNHQGDITSGSFDVRRTESGRWKIESVEFISYNGSYWVEDDVFAHDFNEAVVRPLQTRFGE